MRDTKPLPYLAFLLLCVPSCPTRCYAQTSTRNEIAAHYKRAEDALASGHPDVARDEFQAILKLDPGNAQTYANLGVIAYKAGDFEQAKQLFETALGKNSSLWDAKAFLGLSDTRLGDVKAGMPLLEASFPHIRNASVKIDAGVAIIKYHQETRTLRAVSQVIHDLEQAMPDDPEVLYVAYRAYSGLAAEELRALSNRAPDSARIHQVYGEAAMTQDDFAAAILHFRKALEVDPHLPGAHFQLGLALLTNAQDAPTRQQARQEFESELKQDPSDAHAEYELAETFRLDAKPADAAIHYTRALRLQPDLVDAHIGLGNIVNDAGKPEEAIPQYLEATRLDPDNETAHYRLARAYRATGRLQDADREMTSFQRLHEINESRSPRPVPSESSHKDDHSHKGEPAHGPVLP